MKSKISYTWKHRILLMIGGVFFGLYTIGYHTGFLAGICIGVSVTLNVFQKQIEEK